MATRLGWHRLLVGAALAVAGACGATTTPTTPTTPSAPANTTDTFQGTLGQTGSINHIFAVAANGTVTVSLTTVTPLSTMSLGVAVSTSDGTSCLTPITQNSDARAGSVALTGTATTGNYCVRVYDSGNIPPSTDVSYTLQIVHP